MAHGIQYPEIREKPTRMIFGISDLRQARSVARRSLLRKTGPTVLTLAEATLNKCKRRNGGLIQGF